MIVVMICSTIYDANWFFQPLFLIIVYLPWKFFFLRSMLISVRLMISPFHIKTENYASLLLERTRLLWFTLLGIFFRYKNNVGQHLWKFIFVQVWNAVTGNKLYTFEGHKAPAYSMCPHNKENLHVCSCFICNFAS